MCPIREPSCQSADGIDDVHRAEWRCFGSDQPGAQADPRIRAGLEEPDAPGRCVNGGGP